MATTRAADNKDNKFDGNGATGNDSGSGVTTTLTMMTMAMMAPVRWATAWRDMTMMTKAMGDNNDNDNNDNDNDGWQRRVAEDDGDYKDDDNSARKVCLVG